MGGNVGLGTTNPRGGLVVLNGNLGVGTTNPVERLEVNGGAYVHTQGGGAINLLQLENTAGGGNGTFLAFYNTGNLTSQVGGYDGQFTAGTVVAGPVSLKTNDIVRMTIDSTGNVGVGTTGPVGALTVMNGNVGIGTWSPTARLQVIGTVNATAFVGDGSGLTGLPAGGGWTDGGTNVYTSTTTDLVAIGTTTPVSKLMLLSQQRLPTQRSRHRSTACWSKAMWASEHLLQIAAK
jgi:hypothetical protein